MKGTYFAALILIGSLAAGYVAMRQPEISGSASDAEGLKPQNRAIDQFNRPVFMRRGANACKHANA